jgi:hypothetical protein
LLWGEALNSLRDDQFSGCVTDAKLKGTGEQAKESTRHFLPAQAEMKAIKNIEEFGGD